ncbi:MAG: hypothetical protein K2X10_10290 [Hyphomicrobiales bacterium]|nr:hypothetical protein [Hyphomicrobiales bacterium]
MDDFTVPFQEAIDFFRQKVTIPSKTWRDILGRSHDRAFVVAGATKEALLADLRAEIDQAIAGKTTLADFRAKFDEIVAHHGWSGFAGDGSEGGRAWRTRVIYESNLKTSYAAGRYAQMTDPDIVKVYKWWRYRHAFYRIPIKERYEHAHVWDGLVLAWDDPWWNTHYPPNGWNCSCGVETLSDRDLKAEGISPSTAPDLGTRSVVDPKTGEKVSVPNGIDFGWDHAPGQDWARGVVPPQLQKPLKASIGPAKPPQPLSPLSDRARPFKAKLLKAGQSDEEYVSAFLDAFGAAPGKPVLWRDPAGHALVISDNLFRDGRGHVKLWKDGRGEHSARLAEAIRDPDEIWLNWAIGPDGKVRLVRRYLRSSPDSPEFASFAWSGAGWEGATAFSPARSRALKPDPDYLERQRVGALLWRR